MGKGRKADFSQRIANHRIDDRPMRLNLTGGFKDAILLSLLDTGSHGDRAFNGLDNIGKADRRRRTGELDTTAGTADRFQQSTTRQKAHQLLGCGQRNAGFFGKLGRARTGAPAMLRSRCLLYTSDAADDL